MLNFQLRLDVLLITLEVKGHTVPYWKALRYAKMREEGLVVVALLAIVRMSSKVSFYWSVLNLGQVLFVVKT